MTTLGAPLAAAAGSQPVPANFRGQIIARAFTYVVVHHQEITHKAAKPRNERLQLLKGAPPSVGSRCRPLCWTNLPGSSAL